MKERYSFSKLSSFYTCPYGYKLSYGDKIRGEGNAFASYGSLVHSVMERYEKGEIDLWDLSDTFINEYKDKVKEKFPPCSFCDLENTYYSQAVEFLNNFNGFDNAEIISVEKEFETDIGDFTFNGFIDLIYKQGNKIIIQDWKSKSSFKSKKEQKKYARQLYLYSKYVKEKYGQNPDILRFYLFRKNKPIDIVFSDTDYEEAINWAIDTVKKIREEKVWNKNKDEFFCNNLCNHRNSCTKG